MHPKIYGERIDSVMGKENSGRDMNLKSGECHMINKMICSEIIVHLKMKVKHAYAKVKF